MKIAVLFRGPLRPSPAHSRSYIERFMQNFAEIGIKPSTYLVTWRPDRVDADVSALIERDIDNFISITMPPKDMIGEHLYETFLFSGHRARNMFYQHYSSKLAIDLIVGHGEYDFIIHTRTDIYIDFGGDFAKWLSDDRRTKYQAMHIRDAHPESFLNDQFGVASPSNMKKAWNYGSLEQLRSKIAFTVENRGRAEDVLQMILDEAGVDITWGPAVTFYLDSERHTKTGV